MSTGKTQLERVPAGQADLIAILGRLPPHTVRAWVWKDGDEVVAAAGWYMAGTRAVVFSDMREAAAPKLRIWREALRFMADLKAPAICVAESVASAEFLKRLGWTHFYTGPDGEVFQCNC